jgi:Trypsin
MADPYALQPGRRRALVGLVASLGTGLAAPAHAMMAGAPPDTPLARVDANRPESPWSGVVSVVVAGAPYSGVALSPLHVLTAGHVAAGRAPSVVQVSVNAAATPITLQAASVAGYPGFAFPYDDLAIVTLAQPLPATTPFHPVVDTPPTLGELVTLVGYGASGQGGSGPSVNGSAAVKRIGRNALDQLTDRLDASGRSSPFFVYDFDGPSGNGPLGGPTLGNALETCVASGDSGAPAFVDRDGGPALLGLCSVSLAFGGTASVFGAGGAGPVLAHAPYLDWLRAQTAGAVQFTSQTQVADVPLAPVWAQSLAACALGALLARRARR